MNKILPNHQPSARLVNPRRDERGSAAVLAAVVIIPMIAFAALAVDVGRIMVARSRLQNSADAAATAGAVQLPDAAEVRSYAGEFAATNYSSGGNVLDTQQDVEIGKWDNDSLSFTYVTDAAEANSVRVTTRRAEVNGNPFPLLLSALFGYSSMDITARATVLTGALDGVDALPMALRTPDFGTIDPKITAVNPGKDGPSYPSNGSYFEIGEQVTVAIYGKGKKSPVHLTLEVDNAGPGAAESDVKKVLRGEQEPAHINVGDRFLVFNEGTGSGGFLSAIDDRVDGYGPDDPMRTVILPVVKSLDISRNEKNEIDGPVEVVDFAAVHLDGVLPQSVPDPEKPGRFIDIEVLSGTIVRASGNGGLVRPPSTVMPTPSVFRTVLVSGS